MDTRARRHAHRRSATRGYGTAPGAETDLAELRARCARMGARWLPGTVADTAAEPGPPPGPPSVRAAVTVPARSLRLLAGMSEYGPAPGA